jgi:hypothetical protein
MRIEPMCAEIVERILHIAGRNNRRQQTSNHTLHVILSAPLLCRIDKPRGCIFVGADVFVNDMTKARAAKAFKLAGCISKFQRRIPRRDDPQQRGGLGSVRQMSQMNGRRKRRNKRTTVLLDGAGRCFLGLLRAFKRGESIAQIADFRLRARRCELRYSSIKLLFAAPASAAINNFFCETFGRRPLI